MQFLAHTKLTFWDTSNVDYNYIIVSNQIMLGKGFSHYTKMHNLSTSLKYSIGQIGADSSVLLKLITGLKMVHSNVIS